MAGKGNLVWDVLRGGFPPPWIRQVMFGPHSEDVTKKIEEKRRREVQALVWGGRPSFASLLKQLLSINKVHTMIN